MKQRDPAMNIAVIDYAGGNLASAARALSAAAARQSMDAEILITADPAKIAAADRVVLPGQGAFADCKAGLSANPALLAALQDKVATGAPFLGICVGMQLMAERGLEHAITPGFGWIEGEIAPMAATGLRLPHMGWNVLDFVPGSHPLLAGLRAGTHGYFVHSYALRGYNAAQVLGTTQYGGTVPALVVNGNRAGTQFHVEKSQEAGLRILGNFLRWTP
jgi:glutamine amidotransferase